MAALSANEDGSLPEPAAEPALGSALGGGHQLEDPADESTGDGGPDTYRAASSQLQQLVELGFPEEVAAQYCDGVTPVEELIDQIMLASDGNQDEAPGRPSASDSSGARRKSKAPFHWAAKRFMGK